MSKLPHDLRMMIDKLCQKGDQFAQIDQPDDALDQYEAAWELLPSPKNQWPAATWILLAAGDVYFEQRNFVVAEQTLHEALNFPDGETNPFIWLRLGQCRFELGDLNGAALWCKANMKKPVVGFIAGVTAPPGKRMGHAGALISGGADTADAKLAVMEECGFKVTRNPSEMAALLKAML
jgi:tetratricopeptide (TPR) repeat protein